MPSSYHVLLLLTGVRSVYQPTSTDHRSAARALRAAQFLSPLGAPWSVILLGELVIVASTTLPVSKILEWLLGWAIQATF